MHRQDQELVCEAKQNPQRFDALYNKHFQTIYNYFWYRVGHDDDVADDLTQDTFIRAFEALPTFIVTDTSYLSYLLTIAHNLLVNWYRKPTPISLDAMPDIPVNGLKEVVDEDDLYRLWLSIQKLPHRQRDVLYLKYRRGFSVAEIAQIVNKSENAVKLLLSRARKNVSSQLPVTVLADFGEVKRKPSKARYKNIK